MQQQFARPGFVVIGYISMRIGTDMQVEQECLAVFDEAVGILKVCFALADRFYFGSAQGHAGFKPFDQEVVMTGGTVESRVPVARGYRVAGTRRFGRSRPVGGGDNVTGLA